MVCKLYLSLKKAIWGNLDLVNETDICFWLRWFNRDWIYHPDWETEKENKIPGTMTLIPGALGSGGARSLRVSQVR